MADPRFRNGFTRSDWHKRRPALDTPFAHGWQLDGVNHQGYAIFTLDGAYLRRSTPGECNDDWIVVIGEAVYGFSGPLEQITQEVRAMLAGVTPEARGGQ